MKKISFSLFGSDPKYYVGAKKNIEQYLKFLPDWEVSIYYHPSNFLDSYYNILVEAGGTLIDVTDFKLGHKEAVHYPFFWRFFAFLEDSISVARDLDSRPSEREIEYINRWLESDCKYSIIRDHPWHAPVPSGLFGVKGADKLFEEHFTEFVNTSNLCWGADQEILHTFIEKVPASDVHYSGYDKPDTYIPRTDKSFFIGMQLDENDTPTVPSGEKCLSFLNELNL